MTARQPRNVSSCSDEIATRRGLEKKKFEVTKPKVRFRPIADIEWVST